MAERDYRLPPPASQVPRHVLWRQLLRRPRPCKEIAYRHPLAPNVQLSVVALSGSEDAEVFDQEYGESELIRGSRVVARMISKALWTPTQRAFSSADDVLRMTTVEVTLLGNAVFDALSEVSPVYYRSDAAAWDHALKEGARHRTNRHEAVNMFYCCDHGLTSAPVKRPTRYFGLPGIELTDGHRMAFSAAVDWVKEVSGTAD